MKFYLVYVFLSFEMHIVNLRTDLTAAAALNDSKGFAVLAFFIEVSLCFTKCFQTFFYSLVAFTACDYYVVALYNYILRQPMTVANLRAGRTSPPSYQTLLTLVMIYFLYSKKQRISNQGKSITNNIHNVYIMVHDINLNTFKGIYYLWISLAKSSCRISLQQ